jgi:cell division protein FtsA
MSNFITGIDLGSSAIKLLVARINNESSEFEVLAKVCRPSSGVRKGVIANPDEVSDIVSSCIEEAESQINGKIDGVYSNINGSHIFSNVSRGLVSVSRADQKISSEDIDRVLQAARAFPLSKNKEILEVFPREFIIDGEQGIKNPLEMRGIRFEVEALIIGGFSPYVRNATQAIIDSGIQLDDLVLSQIASARAVLNSREKELGVALLDIGAGTASLIVFQEGSLIHAAVFPIGSNDITNDIAIGLRTDIDTAEKIKLEFGSCLAGRNDQKKEKVKSLESGEEIVFSRAFLRKIIEARVSEIFDLVEAELKKISKNHLLPAGIVLTGGGSKMPQTVDLVKKTMKLPCRIGQPNGFNPIIEDPCFSGVCGLILQGSDLEDNDGSDGFGSKVAGKIKRVLKNLIP